MIHATIVHVDVGLARDNSHRLGSCGTEPDGFGVERVGDNDCNVRISVARGDQPRSLTIERRNDRWGIGAEDELESWDADCASAEVVGIP